MSRLIASVMNRRSCLALGAALVGLAAQAQVQVLSSPVPGVTPVPKSGAIPHGTGAQSTGLNRPTKTAHRVKR